MQPLLKWDIRTFKSNLQQKWFGFVDVIQDNTLQKLFSFQVKERLFGGTRKWVQSHIKEQFHLKNKIYIRYWISNLAKEVFSILSFRSPSMLILCYLEFGVVKILPKTKLALVSFISFKSTKMWQKGLRDGLRVHTVLLENLSPKTWVKGQFIDNIHQLQLQFHGIKCPWPMQLLAII